MLGSTLVDLLLKVKKCEPTSYNFKDTGQTHQLLRVVLLPITSGHLSQLIYETEIMD